MENGKIPYAPRFEQFLSGFGRLDCIEICHNDRNYWDKSRREGMRFKLTSFGISLDDKIIGSYETTECGMDQSQALVPVDMVYRGTIPGLKNNYGVDGFYLHATVLSGQQIMMAYIGSVKRSGNGEKYRNMFNAVKMKKEMKRVDGNLRNAVPIPFP